MAALARAINEFGAGEYARAKSEVDAAIRLDGANWQALKLRGLVAAQAGDAAAAVRYFESVLALCRDDDTILILGEYYWRAGLLDRAIETLSAYLQAHPGHAQALGHLGVAHAHAGQNAAAEVAFLEATRTAPDWVDAWNNLGQVQHRQGKLAEAEASWRMALGFAPQSADVLFNLASLCDGIPGRRDEAIGFLERGVAVAPSAKRYLDLASLMRQAGDVERSLPCYEKALELDPAFGEAYDSLGCLNFEHGNCGDAEMLFRKAVSLEPRRAEFLTNLGAALYSLGKNDEAEEVFRRAIAASPDSARIYSMLAVLLAVKGRPYEAMEAGRKAIELDPQHQDALAQLAALEGDAGQVDLALEHYRQANAVMRNDAIRILMAMLVPPIMGTREEVEKSRQRVDRELDALLADPAVRCSLEDLKLLTESGFYFAFHGRNDRALLSKYSQVLRQACPELSWVSPHLNQPRLPEERLRVGFVSAFFFHHSVGMSFGAVIKGLAQRGDMDVFLISIGQQKALNPLQVELISACQHFVPLSDVSLESARETLASLQLDILFYADIGMRPFSNLLAHSRVAPVQGLLGGHPNTSGISTIDHFLSWGRLEPEGSEAAYSEHLIRLEHGTTVLWRQQIPAEPYGRDALGLPADGRLYVCPMKLQKLHPDFDAVLGEILAKDDEGRIVLFQDGTYHEWHGYLRQRMTATIPVHLLERVIFLPWMTEAPRLLAVNALADAVLDPLHFGGGTTAVMLAEAGIPMITTPGRFARSRVVSALYDLLGVTDTVAHSVGDYADLAVRFARDAALRRDVGRRLAASYGQADDRDDVVHELAAVIRQLGTAAGR